MSRDFPGARPVPQKTFLFLLKLPTNAAKVQACSAASRRFRGSKSERSETWNLRAGWTSLMPPGPTAA